jgi:hypothetical protein
LWDFRLAMNRAQPTPLENHTTELARELRIRIAEQPVPIPLYQLAADAETHQADSARCSAALYR